MSKKTKRILIGSIIAAVLLSLAAVGIWGFWLPYHSAVSSFVGDKSVVMYLQDNGSVEITWPLGKNADKYLLEVIDPRNGEVEYSSYVTGSTSHVLPALAQQKRTIRIQTVASYSFLFGGDSRNRMGENAIEITDIFTYPKIAGVTSIPYPDTDQLLVALDVPEGSNVRLYKLTTGQLPTPTNTFSDKRLILSFGEGQQWGVPAYGETYTFAFDAYRQGEGYTFYGPMSSYITLSREDLLDTELQLQSLDNGDNTFTLSWNETKGDYYEFQYRATEKKKWNTLLRVSPTEERSYTTGNLAAYSYGEYRVIALHNDGETVAESEMMPVQMGAAVAYSTIWPIMDLEIYTDTLKTQSIGTAEKGKAFCVLQVKDGMFRIRFGNDYGYIDSTYCMINLPECMGDLCKYNITNSYASIFKIHEYPIPGLTDQVIQGYENVRMGEEEDPQYLVPLLYPVVERLGKAAQAAKKAGYTLKIYDAYRPRVATQLMYSTVVEYAENTMVPTETPPVTGDSTTPTDPTTSTTPTEPQQQMTFAQFMSNNGKYKMNYFVAKGTSRHNRGAALDLTLESEEGEVLMQTSLHDLSWYSETAQNNDGAKTLAKIMKNAGFGGLVSEWWHFQDDEVLKNLEPPALDAGVTPECWMADGNGWRYRTVDGTYLINCTKTIDGTKYKFDKQGYANPV